MHWCSELRELGAPYPVCVFLRIFYFYLLTCMKKKKRERETSNISIAINYCCIYFTLTLVSFNPWTVTHSCFPTILKLITDELSTLLSLNLCASLLRIIDHKPVASWVRFLFCVGLHDCHKKDKDQTPTISALRLAHGAPSFLTLASLCSWIDTSLIRIESTKHIAMTETSILTGKKRINHVCNLMCNICNFQIRFPDFHALQLWAE